jgi:hypothetical protein
VGGTLDPGASVCGLARCGRLCGSALGGRLHRIRQDLLWPRPRLATRAHPKPPWVLERPKGARRFALKRSGSVASCRRRGLPTVTRPVPQNDIHGSTTRQDKERSGLWPGVGTRRRHSAARRLGAGRSTVRWLRSRGRGRMGASRSLARTRNACDTSEVKTFPRSGLLLLSPVAHGSSTMAELGLAFTAAEGSKRSRPTASKGVHLIGDGTTRGTLKALPLPCARVH